MMGTTKRSVEPARTGPGPRRRRFAQHFLEPAWVAKVTAAIAPKPGETFLEIGPGRGALTLALAAAGGSVVAVEIDRDLAAWLAAQAPPGVRIVCADALDADLRALLADFPFPAADGTVRVAGNLPYNVSSPVLFRLLRLQAAEGLFRDATLMLQREVVDRIIATPGSRDYGVLSILVGLHARATCRLRLPPGAFRPMPKVESALVHLAFRPPPVAVGDAAFFERLVRSLFTRRRKTLANALAPFADACGVEPRSVLTAAGLGHQRRPESLELAELARLASAMAPRHRGAVL